MRLLHRRDVELHAVHPVEAPRVVDPLAPHRAEHERERLVEAVALLRRVDAVAGELVCEVAAADAEVEPAARQAVDHRVRLGDLERVVEGQDAHRHAEADAAGPGGDGREEHRGIRAGAVLVEVVLGHPEGAEAQLLGRNGLLDHLVVELIDAAWEVEIVVEDREDAEVHPPAPAI